MLTRFWLMSDPLIRRSRSTYAMQADIISLDIRFIPVEHTHSFVPKSPQLWLTAQSFLRRYQYGLKIWDAYRPVAVQAMLWDASHNSDYVANPEIGAGSLHSWGIAVDATLVDSRIRDVRMPTDFDDFTPAAMLPYMGSSFEIRRNLRLLRYAMHKAGFCGLRTEWWHFTILGWQKYLPPEKAKSAAQALETHEEGGL